MIQNLVGDTSAWVGVVGGMIQILIFESPECISEVVLIPNLKKVVQNSRIFHINLMKCQDLFFLTYRISL